VPSPRGRAVGRLGSGRVTVQDSITYIYGLGRPTEKWRAEREGTRVERIGREGIDQETGRAEGESVGGQRRGQRIGAARGRMRGTEAEAWSSQSQVGMSEPTIRSVPSFLLFKSRDREIQSFS
jgi:hypothetical protein